MTTELVREANVAGPRSWPRARRIRDSFREGPLHLLVVITPMLTTLALFVLLAVRAARQITNNDTYFHLRFGQEFLDGAWSLRHPGSVTSYGTNDWVPTQWLTQMAMARVEDAFGLGGVACLAGLLHIGLALTLWTIARRHAGPMVAILTVTVALLAASAGLSMRPQVISFIFVAVTTAAWVSSREDAKPRWWLIPLTWVWAACHGMWPVGILIGVVAVVGLALDRAVTRRQWFALAAIPLLSAGAAAVTPVGPRLYAAVLLVNSRGQYFAEWQPPDFTSSYALSFLGLAGVLLLLMMRRQRRTSWTECLLVLLAGGFGLYTVRTVPVAAMMLVPFAARAVQELFAHRRPVARPERAVTVVGAVLCLVGLAVVAPRTADQPPPEPAWFTTLADLPAGTVVLNEWAAGGYLMWRFPDLDLVMNGYADIYTDAELSRNVRMDAGYPGWLRDVKGIDTRYAVVEPGSILAVNLIDIAHWRVVDRSAKLELLVPPDDWPATQPG